jgi:hypothetical protein
MIIYKRENNSQKLNKKNEFKLIKISKILPFSNYI